MMPISDGAVHITGSLATNQEGSAGTLCNAVVAATRLVASVVTHVCHPCKAGSIDPRPRLSPRYTSSLVVAIRCQLKRKGSHWPARPLPNRSET